MSLSAKLEEYKGKKVTAVMQSERFIYIVRGKYEGIDDSNNWSFSQARLFVTGDISKTGSQSSHSMDQLIGTLLLTRTKTGGRIFIDRGEQLVSLCEEAPSFLNPRY